MRQRPAGRGGVHGALVMLGAMLFFSTSGCGPAGDAPGRSEDDTAPQARTASGEIAALLADGLPVFGIFSGEKTAEQGALMAGNRETDFVFYSLEQGPLDIPTLEAYMDGVAEGSGD